MKNRIEKYYIYVPMGVASLGGFLFGFDVVIGRTVKEFLKLQFHLTSSQLGLFLTAFLLGGIFGIVVVARFVDVYGRKQMMGVAAILYVISNVVLVFSAQYSSVLLCRVSAGMAIGIASTVSPLYICELAPCNRRGKYLLFYQMAIVLGAIWAFIFNALIEKGIDNRLISSLFVFHSWKGLFLFGGLVSLVYLVLLFVVPESPKSLDQFRKNYQLLMASSELHGPKRVYFGLEYLKATTDFLLKVPTSKMLMITIFLVVFTPFTGIQFILFYMPRILEFYGVSSQLMPIPLIWGSVAVVFIFITMKFIDRIGCRPIYLFSSIGAALAFAITGFTIVKGEVVLAVILFLILFVAISLASIKVAVAAEIFPLAIRGTSFSVCMMVIWLSDWFMCLAYPLISYRLSMFLLSVGGIFSFLFARRFLPETRGKSLEEIEKEIYAATINYRSRIYKKVEVTDEI